MTTGGPSAPQPLLPSTVMSSSGDTAASAMPQQGWLPVQGMACPSPTLGPHGRTAAPCMVRRLCRRCCSLAGLPRSRAHRPRAHRPAAACSNSLAAAGGSQPLSRRRAHRSCSGSGRRRSLATLKTRYVYVYVHVHACARACMCGVWLARPGRPRLNTAVVMAAPTRMHMQRLHLPCNSFTHVAFTFMHAGAGQAAAARGPQAPQRGAAQPRIRAGGRRVRSGRPGGSA